MSKKGGSRIEFHVLIASQHNLEDAWDYGHALEEKYPSILAGNSL